MKILHIIPAAWHYFDVIRDQAFQMIEAESRLGLEVEAFTFQYSRPNERSQQAIYIQAPSRTFAGHANLKQVIESLDTFEVINVHCPFLGAVPDIIRWKRQHPAKPIIVTYHGRLTTTDLFGVFISWYNAWYESKLFRAAETIVALQPLSARPKKAQVVDLTNSADALQLMPEVYLKALYSNFVNNHII
ncbi:MAG: hypothetical protein A3I29_04690 [Candidatus Magasanikbacteria bacterium RIFCSPLOWO2_02_FULL_44_11]|uniref:Glycosyltransferase subfamily 4-like N-terminal domain-containing protein n=2 Tax=Candidatus Magasanikiibacteriota TaxID=1752731 RepID=A0A1F6N8J3_9BACT|nr:MAG: hypothetical protein A3D53_03345 [Candidatus Magasanikbacteria bacterium RIFCSPHIGHO2_02_FULL_45_10]OGH80305.1 MAG: hypothetical protein A3I29_04690 [Candidatus Magasanikbacteria bacterium RIFCSPLOWO2_02_FULL_44_11]